MGCAQVPRGVEERMLSRITTTNCEVLRCCYASWTEGVVEVQDSPRRETRRYIVFMTPRNDAVMVQPCGYLTRRGGHWSLSILLLLRCTRPPPPGASCETYRSSSRREQRSAHARKQRRGDPSKAGSSLFIACSHLILHVEKQIRNHSTGFVRSQYKT